VDTWRCLSTQHCSTETRIKADGVSGICWDYFPHNSVLRKRPFPSPKCSLRKNFPHNSVLRKRAILHTDNPKVGTFHTTLFYGNMQLNRFASHSLVCTLSTQLCSTETRTDVHDCGKGRFFPHNSVLRKRLMTSGILPFSSIAFHTTLFYGNPSKRCIFCFLSAISFHTTLFYGNILLTFVLKRNIFLSTQLCSTETRTQAG